MFIKKIHYYIFYKIYKTIQHTSGPFGNFLNGFKASLAMMALELWILTSLGIYYSILTKTVIELSIYMPIVYVPLLFIIGFNFYIFDYLDEWKKYIKEFDQLPRSKNIIGGIVVWVMILLVIANLIYSFYLMSQIDWSRYR